MIPSVIVFILVSIFNMVIVLPLSYIGSLISGDWTTAFQSGLQFMLRPLFYSQNYLDVPMMLRMIGWDSLILNGWIVWLVVKWIAGLIRGHSPELNSRQHNKK